VCFLAAIIGGFFVLKNVTSGAPQDFSLATTTSASATSSAAGRPSATPQAPTGSKEYRNKQYGFSIYYPDNLPPKEYVTPRIPELTVAFQAEQGGEGFQIYVAPIDGNEITEERFLRDEASGVRKDPHDAAVDGVKALAFNGFDAAMGQTYEVWFIRKGFLYEVSTYKELESGLNEIMSTWRFI
jgi:hypothetical protein